MKTHIIWVLCLLLPSFLSCSDEIVDESDSSDRNEYVLNFSLGMNQSEADVKAVPDRTGEVGENFEFSETYDKSMIYLRQDNSDKCLPFKVTSSSIYMTITQNGDELTVANEEKTSISLSLSNNTKFYFASHPGNVVNTTEKIDGKDWQRPIGDNVFKSDPLQFNIQNGKLYFNGQPLADLKIPEIKMNRSTCVFMPVVMITNVNRRFLESERYLTKEEFESTLGNLASWKVNVYIPNFPTQFDLSAIWKGVSRTEIVGKIIEGSGADLLLMENTNLVPKSVVKKRLLLSDLTYKGFAAIGPNNSFIYWSYSIPYVYIPIDYQGTRKTLRVKLGSEINNNEQLSFDYRFFSNTHYTVNFILDYKDVQNAFGLNKKTRSLDNSDDEYIDIPCEVIVD